MSPVVLGIAAHPRQDRGQVRKVYEIDPLLCPYCGSQLRIIAFLVDFASLRRLLAHLGFAPQQPEPLAHAPPDAAETFATPA